MCAAIPVQDNNQARKHSGRDLAARLMLLQIIIVVMLTVTSGLSAAISSPKTPQQRAAEMGKSLSPRESIPGYQQRKRSATQNVILDRCTARGGGLSIRTSSMRSY
jgi:hypothetical protein